MRLSPERESQIWKLVLGGEVLRVGACLALMVGLTVSDFTLWLALPLPVLTYIGISLIFNDTSERSTPRSLSNWRQDKLDRRRDLAAFEECIRVQTDLKSLTSAVSDEHIATWLTLINKRIGEIRGVIEEDVKFKAAPELLKIVAYTRGVVVNYERASRRSLPNAEPVERIRSILAILSGQFDQLWAELNRDVLVDLQVLVEIIKLEFPDPSDDPISENSVLVIEPEVSAAAVGAELDNDDAINNEKPIKLAADQVGSAGFSGWLENGEHLTAQELVVLRVLRSNTDRQIAEALFISPRSVGKHLQNLMRKFGVHNRQGLLLEAIRQGIIDPVE